MNRLRVYVLGLLCALHAMPSVAGGAEQAVTARDGWVREVPPVARNSAGYVVIENAGDVADVLVGARVDGARVTEIHEMVHDGDSLVMRRRAEVEVPAGGRIALAPGGLHLMLIDLQRPLRAGEKRDAVLRFRRAGEVKVVMDVRVP